MIGCASGVWVINVKFVLGIQHSQNLLLRMTLEPRGRMRNAGCAELVSAPDLELPQKRKRIADRIRRWLETTDGDDYLDLSA